MHASLKFRTLLALYLAFSCSVSLLTIHSIFLSGTILTAIQHLLFVCGLKMGVLCNGSHSRRIPFLCVTVHGNGGAPLTGSWKIIAHTKMRAATFRGNMAPRMELLVWNLVLELRAQNKGYGAQHTAPMCIYIGRKAGSKVWKFNA